MFETQIADAWIPALVGLANRCTTIGTQYLLLLEDPFHSPGNVALGCRRFLLSIPSLRPRRITTLSAATLASLCLLRFPDHCRSGRPDILSAQLADGTGAPLRPASVRSPLFPGPPVYVSSGQGLHAGHVICPLRRDPVHVQRRDGSPRTASGHHPCERLGPFGLPAGASRTTGEPAFLHAGCWSLLWN